MKDSIGFLLNDAARLYRRAFNARIRDEGFTALQWRLMVYLNRYPGIRQGPMADLIEVEPITLSRMVDRLVDSGFVERHADPADRRAWLLHLTARAENLLEHVRPVGADLNELACDGLSDDERDRLFTLVERVRSNLSQRATSKNTTSKDKSDEN